MFEKLIERVVNRVLARRLGEFVRTIEVDPDKYYLLVVPKLEEAEIESLSSELRKFTDKRNVAVIVSDNVSVIKLT